MSKGNSAQMKSLSDGGLDALLAETPGEDTTSQLWRGAHGEYRMVVMALPAEGGQVAAAEGEAVGPDQSPRVFLNQAVDKEEALRFFSQAGAHRHVEKAEAF